MSTTNDDPEFEELLNYLKQNRAFDFTGYKRVSLMRRISRRLQAVNCNDFGDYQDYLEVHPEEFAHLFESVLINVTAFFRDKTAWDYIAQDIVPRILATRLPDAPIRVWSAGCASGEEAYTLAMILAEAVGLDALREQVKIYATDIDEDALNQARQATYTEKEIAGVPPEFVEKYFERIETHYIFRKDLRRSVIFGRHDLIQDAPISRIDLLVCRNVLMYFNTEAQGRIKARFHFALADTGFLFLGKAEMLYSSTALFSPIELSQRIFSKIPRANGRERLFPNGNGDMEETATSPASLVRARELAFDAGPVAQIVVDSSGALAQANERARVLFSLMPRDLGRPLQYLEISYRPVELRSWLEQSYAERRVVIVKDIQWRSSNGDVRWLDVHIVPLYDTDKVSLGATISFLDMTRYQRLQTDLEQANQALETAYEELQSANEELETTNEELQSTVEELETTNEELQSTNEELETMNEELQSTNEELQTINDELRERSEELRRVHSGTEAILASLRSGVIVLAPDLMVQAWNPRSEDMWGLRADEVREKHFLNLDIGLPVEKLRQSVKACLNGEEKEHELTLDAVNRRGRPIQCKIMVSPLLDSDGEIHGALLLIEEIIGA